MIKEKKRNKYETIFLLIILLILVGLCIHGLRNDSTKELINNEDEITEPEKDKDNYNIDTDNNIDEELPDDEMNNDDNDSPVQKDEKHDKDTKKKENKDETTSSINIPQKECTYSKKILTYVGKNNQKIADCEGATYTVKDDNILSISNDGIITPKKIGITTIKIKRENITDEIIVYVDHQRIESGNNTLVLYNVDNASALSTDYDVYVKLPEEKDYHKIQVYKVQVSLPNSNENWNSTYSSYVNFDFKGVVNIKVIPKNNISSFRLRGNIYSQNSRKNGNEILFNLTNYGIISLETKNDIDYNTRTNLHIFANTLDNNFKNININNSNTIYIGPGEHKCANNKCTFTEDSNIMKEKRKPSTSTSSYPSAIDLKSNSIIYISGSAIVHSQITIDKWNDKTKNGTKLSNIKILGRGTLDTSDLITTSINSDKIDFTDSNITSGLIRIVYANSIDIDGIILKNSKSYNIYIKDSDNINISNIKAISSGKYTDGIHILSSRNITANNSFIRTCDDGIAIYSSRGSGNYSSGSFQGLNGNSQNMNFTNMLLWIDNGRSVYIGGHGNYNSQIGNGNEINNIQFNKIHILETNKRIDHEGALTIGSRDNNYVHNISFTNITVDNLINGNLITIKNDCSNYTEETYNNTLATKCGYMIDNISFDTISWNGRYNSITNTNSWINLQGKEKSNSNTCSNPNLESVIKQITFKNIKLGDITLSNSNKINNYKDVLIFNNDSCVSDYNIK